MFNHKELFEIMDFKFIHTLYHRTTLSIEDTPRGYVITTGSARYDKHLLSALIAAQRYIDATSSISIANPYVHEFVSLTSQMSINPYARFTYTDLQSARAAYGDIDWLLYQYDRRIPMLDVMYRNKKRSVIRNRDNLVKYCNSIFDVHSRVLVIRLDLAYKSHVYDDIDILQVIDDRKRFLGKVKRKFKYLISYVWRLEYGVNRTFHYHMVFMFDASHLHSDIQLGKMLGELWEEVCHTCGTHHNCNAYKHKYDECYLGSIRYDDVDKRRTMCTFISYLCQEDRDIQVQLRQRQRCFGRMETPRRSSNAGRPRRQPGPLIE